MSVAVSVLEEELGNLRLLEKSFVDQIVALPPGTIVVKTIRGKAYSYFQFREGRRVVSQLIKSDEELQVRRAAAQERRAAAVYLRKLRLEIREVERVLARLWRIG